MNDYYKSVLKDKVLLVADDEHALRELIVMELNDFGAKCLQANDGREALELIKTNQVDLLLSDVRMPEFSGIDLLEELKDKNLFLTKPIIMMSGFTDLSFEQAKGFGVISIVAKPFVISDILALMANSLDKKCS